MAAAAPLDAAPTSADRHCFHCGNAVPRGADFGIVIGGVRRAMCCPGCRAVAGMISESGMAAFYEHRTGYSERPTEAPAADEQLRVYDDPAVAATFTDTDEQGLRHARLLLGGVSCAACTWLIEHTLQRIDGVASANVNLQHSRLDIALDPDRVALSSIFARLEALGYRAQPFVAQARRELLDRDYRRNLRRLAVAGLGMMQVGMFAIALHAGDLQGIAAEHQSLMRWVSLVIASFVVLFSARTFFENAWRHLRAGALVMDLPVALAIGLAWLASGWATFSGGGQVYFDSVVMFTFFLLLGRFLEQRVRRRFQLNWYDVESDLPTAVRYRRGDGWVSGPRIGLQSGDVVLVPAGTTLPVDGTVLRGRSSVREDTFNGEQQPRMVGPGDGVFAGTLNLEGGLEVSASGPFSATRLAALQQSVGRASGEKPRLWRLADRVSGWFVLGVLLTTALTALAWSQIAPEKALWISLSVLVISCPCALALATPTALTSAASALRRRGVLVHGENALEALGRADHVVFDKTGSLTRGQLALARIAPLADERPESLAAAGAALQRASRHPVARVFDEVAAAGGFDELTYHIGAGVSGRQQGRQWRMGSAAFCRELAPTLPPAPPQSLYWVALVREAQPLAWFGFTDPVREDAAPLLAELQAGGLGSSILSGDTPARVAELGAQLGIPEALGGLSPEQKLEQLEALQARGKVVAAVGDGLNDGPLLARADASFAVAEATDLARAQADFVIEHGDLGAMGLAWRTARLCRRIVWQNMAWALAYNICAIPLAALGYVPPWAAAIGMSASSLLVVLNSLRLTRSSAT
ncbi:heavy metal translocating P-type ATPase [Parahaliea mediterranea]|uniref:Heavy metal translocating P-type ATPase n=1 Tax=Parahaliea mediterranea TaxID=651086 RepID=A0A939IJU2_9GAMM|nr:heavy metal translocating P-type ATPase [Parahaliea mediterranea]